MATFGTATATLATGHIPAGGVTFGSSGIFPATGGTLTDVSCLLSGWSGSGETFRVAVYQGGASASDPSGATLVWQSGELAPTINAAAWFSMTGLGQVPSGAIAASTRTWVVIKNTNDGNSQVDSAVTTDFVINGINFNNHVGTATATAFPSTLGTAIPGTGAETLLAYITYTVTATSAAALAAAYYHGKF